VIADAKRVKTVVVGCVTERTWVKIGVVCFFGVLGSNRGLVRPSGVSDFSRVNQTKTFGG